MSLRRRLLRLLLLLAFAAGGGGIPALDAVLYHHANPADSPQGVHLEPSGSSCHTDTCLTALVAMSGNPDRHLPGGAFPDLDRPVRDFPGEGTPPTLSHRPRPGLPRSPPVS